MAKKGMFTRDVIYLRIKSIKNVYHMQLNSLQTIYKRKNFQVLMADCVDF
jgi:hypothetical protein